MTLNDNVHTHEIEKFGAKANHWWDPRGEFKTLHAVNPLRLQFIRSHTSLEGARIIDVGCGGGILSEGLAQAGGQVTGIDLAEELIVAAKAHAEISKLTIDYQLISAEALAEKQCAGPRIGSLSLRQNGEARWPPVFLDAQPKA